VLPVGRRTVPRIGRSCKYKEIMAVEVHGMRGAVRQVVSKYARCGMENVCQLTL
jgi:hypothetical protein